MAFVLLMKYGFLNAVSNLELSIMAPRSARGDGRSTQNDLVKQSNDRRDTTSVCIYLRAMSVSIIHILRRRHCIMDHNIRPHSHPQSSQLLYYFEFRSLVVDTLRSHKYFIYIIQWISVHSTSPRGYQHQHIVGLSAPFTTILSLSLALGLIWRIRPCEAMNTPFWYSCEIVLCAKLITMKSCHDNEHTEQSERWIGRNYTSFNV